VRHVASSDERRAEKRRGRLAHRRRRGARRGATLATPGARPFTIARRYGTATRRRSKTAGRYTPTHSRCPNRFGLLRSHEVTATNAGKCRPVKGVGARRQQGVGCVGELGLL
jgi:hypothetical protein